MNVEFGSEVVYGDNDKYIKTKIKLYGDKVNINFQGKKVTKENALFKCLSLIILDSAIKVNKKYYSQKLLEKCQYKIKKNKMENFINDHSDLSSSHNETVNGSDNDSDNKLTMMNLMNNLLKS